VSEGTRAPCPFARRGVDIRRCSRREFETFSLTGLGFGDGVRPWTTCRHLGAEWQRRGFVPVCLHPAGPPAAESGPIVLLVEDDAAVAEVYRIGLEAAGYRVIAAEDGQAALDQVADGLPDIVVLDLRLPRMDGFEVLTAVRDVLFGANVPVILLTNFADGPTVERGFSLGARDVLVKMNTTPMALSVEIARWLPRNATAHGSRSAEEPASQETDPARDRHAGGQVDRGRQPVVDGDLLFEVLGREEQLERADKAVGQAPHERDDGVRPVGVEKYQKDVQ
jgi:DNA-binding response OmpR family regulator